MKKFPRKALALLMAFAMVFSLMSVNVFADTDATFNHGQIEISADSADDGNVITLKEGESADITISPYVHVQYKGCGESHCPASCGDEMECFEPGKGCSCFTEAVERKADVAVNVEPDDESIISVSETSADNEVDATKAGEKASGTVTITAVGEGTAQVTVKASLLNWIEGDVTYTVKVTDESGEPDEDDVQTVGIVDFDVYTDHADPIVPELSMESDTQTAYVTLDFAQAMKIVDEEALIEEMMQTVKVHGQTLGGSMGTIGNVALTNGGKSLTFEWSKWAAPYSGQLTSSGVWENLTTEDGKKYADSDVSMIIPNGLTTEIVEQTVADDENNASATIRIIAPASSTRGMVHLVVLKNGKPIPEGNLTSYGATATGHWHNYLTMTADTFVDWYYGSIQSALGEDNYTVTADGDTITITAKDSEPGDVLDLHVLSYLNNGSKTINTAALEEAVAAAEAADESLYTKDSYAEMASVLQQAKTIIADTTYYAQTDADSAAEKLNAAVDALEAVQAAKIVDFDAYTDHDRDVVVDETTDLQTLYVSLTFDKSMTIVDEDALIEEMDASVSFGMGGDIGDLSLSEDGKTLSFTVSGWWAGTAGRFTSTGTWSNLVTADGQYADATASFIVPNGLETVIVDQVVADDENNASVTTQIVNPGNATRGMVHLVVLKNGQPITETNANGAMITGHFHAYLTLTEADFIAAYVENIQGTLGDGYEVTADGDTLTITAKDSEPGDVLEFHISSYLNNGSKNVNVEGLEMIIASAEAIDESLYTEDSYAELTSALQQAKTIIADTTYYAQTDIDNAAEKLDAAIESLEKIQKVRIVDFDAYTDHDRDVVVDETTDLQTLYVSLTFDKPVGVVNADALLADMDASISFGMGGDIGDLSLSEDGKTLSFTVSGWWAGTAGRFTSTGTWRTLVSDDGEYVDANISFIVPNGLETVIVDQVVADDENNASVTTQIVNPGNATRGMVHLVVLKNGQPITATNANGAMITGHFHAYLTWTTEEFIAAYVETIQETLGDGYEVTADGDTLTITAKDSEPGDVLEFHISSYLNDGSKTVNAEGLEIAIAAAEAIDGSLYTEDSYAELTSALQQAKTIIADTTYYAQTDIDNAAEKLNAAINALVKLNAEPGDNGNNENPAVPGQEAGNTQDPADNAQGNASNNAANDTAAATGDETPAGLLIALIVASAAVGGGIAVRKKAA